MYSGYKPRGFGVSPGGTTPQAQCFLPRPFPGKRPAPPSSPGPARSPAVAPPRQPFTIFPREPLENISQAALTPGLGRVQRRLEEIHDGFFTDSRDQQEIPRVFNKLDDDFYREMYSDETYLYHAKTDQFQSTADGSFYDPRTRRSLEPQDGLYDHASKSYWYDGVDYIPSRTQLKETMHLTEAEAREQSKQLAGEKGQEVKPLTKDVKPKALLDLTKILRAQANAAKKRYDKERDASKDVSAGSTYDNVLRLAMKEVGAKYGALFAEAAQSILAKSTKDIKLHQADSRWEKAKDNKALITTEAQLAAQYMADTDPKVKSVLKKIAQLHKPDDLGSVEHAYLEALAASGDEKLFSLLAECRIRWSPVTIGSDIYIETPPDMTDPFAAWTNFKYLVHEVVHTAAHPAFEEYVHQEAPPEAANTILEGTVDYFAQEVWEGIVTALKANKVSAEIGIVQAVLSGGTKTVKAPLLQALQEWAARPLYVVQQPVIDQAVKSLENGPERLRSAFFYGNVHHFFPPYKRRETQSQGVEMDLGEERENPKKPSEARSTTPTALEELDALREAWQKTTASTGNPPNWDDFEVALTSTLHPPSHISPQDVLQEQRGILTNAKSRWGL